MKGTRRRNLILASAAVLSGLVLLLLALLCCILLMATFLLLAGSMGGAMEPEPTEAPGPTEPEPIEPTTIPPTTGAPAPTAPSATDVPEPTVAPPEEPTPIPEVEQRIAEVEWPASMRVGDSDVVRFSLLPAPEGGYVAQPEVEGHEVEPEEVPLTVARPGYTGYAIVTLSAAGLEAESAAPEKQLLVPGQANTWRWTIAPDEAGTYRVVVNLTVRWEPEAGSDLPGPLEENVWSRLLSVEARTTLGFSGKQANWMGAGGSVLGVVSGLPFAEKALEELWKRFKRRRGEERAADTAAGEGGAEADTAGAGGSEKAE